MADAPQTSKAENKTAPKTTNERVYTIPLVKAWKSPFKRRTKKSVSVVREFIMRHMKVDIVKIGMPLNEKLWGQGVKNPPRRVKVKTAVVDSVAYVDLPESTFEYQKVKETKKAAATPKATPKAESKAEQKSEEPKAAETKVAPKAEPAKKADEKGPAKKAPESKK